MNLRKYINALYLFALKMLGSLSKAEALCLPGLESLQSGLHLLLGDALQPRHGRRVSTEQQSVYTELEFQY